MAEVKTQTIMQANDWFPSALSNTSSSDEEEGKNNNKVQFFENLCWIYIRMAGGASTAL